MDANKTRYEDKKARLNTIISRIILRKVRRIHVSGPVWFIRTENQGHPYSIMEKALGTAVRYAELLKLSNKEFCNLVKSKIIQEKARRAGNILVME